MKRKIDVTEHANEILGALQKGILLNTKAKKFNSMVIGWGQLGTNWSLPAFTVYVREGRFTREQLDANPAFTLSVPTGKMSPEIFRVCGTMSGRDVDKVAEAGLTLEEAEVNGVPGIRECPLTLECRVLYRQEEFLDKYPEKVLKFYPQDVPGTNCGSNRDVHVMYIGEVVDAYVIE